MKRYAVIPYRRHSLGPKHPKGREYPPRLDLAPMTHTEACTWMRNCTTEATGYRLTPWPDNVPITAKQ